MKKAIFWDSDGTLMYGNESFTISLVKAFHQFGYPMDEETARRRKRNICSWDVPWKDHSNRNGEEWWQDLLEDIRLFCRENNVSDEDVELVCSSFRKGVVEFEYEAYPQAKEVLHYFKEKGYENYIISNNFPELGDVFARLGLGEDISGYFTSAAVGYEKPSKEIFEYAIQAAGTPEVKYMIGDNPVTDYQGGLGVGMTPILVHKKVDGLECAEQLTDLYDVIK